MSKRCRLHLGLIVVSLATAAGAQELGREMQVAAASLGAARAQESTAQLVPSGSGWLAFLHRGKDIRAMRIDANGNPDFASRVVLENVNPQWFAAATTDRGLMAAWLRDYSLYTAPLRADGTPFQPEHLIAEHVYGGPLACGPSRCIVTGSYGGPVPPFAVLLDSFGREVGRAEALPVGWIAAAAADPDGFLLLIMSPELTYRIVRLDLAGRSMFEAPLPWKGYRSVAAAFDGEQYVIVGDGGSDWSVRAVAVTLDGEISAEHAVYTPARQTGYVSVGIAWSGTQYLVTFVGIEASGLPQPTDSGPSGGTLFAVRMARDLVVPHSAPMVISDASRAVFTAANGGSFFTIWDGAVGQGTRIGPNGVALAPDILTLRPLDQEPAALAAGANGPIAVWKETDFLTGRTAIRVGSVRDGQARTVAEVANTWGVHAAAVDDDALVAWDDQAPGSAAAIVSGSRTIPVPIDSRGHWPLVAATRSRWLIASSVDAGIEAAIVDRDGMLVTPQPIIVVPTHAARSYQIASDGQTFLVVSTNSAEPNVLATLVDADGHILHRERSATSGDPGGLAWNGQEYAVALRTTGGVTFLRFGPDGGEIGKPMFYATSPWAYVTSFAAFGQDWLMTLHDDGGPWLVHLSGELAALSERSRDSFVAVASSPSGAAYALSSSPYELAPYAPSIRAVVREVLPDGGRPQP